MELFRAADKMTNVLEMSMEKWKLSLTSNGEVLEEVNVKKEMFQGDIL